MVRDTHVKIYKGTPEVPAICTYGPGVRGAVEDGLFNSLGGSLRCPGVVVNSCAIEASKILYKNGIY